MRGLTPRKFYDPLVLNYCLITILLSRGCCYIELIGEDGIIILPLCKSSLDAYYLANYSTSLFFIAVFGFDWYALGDAISGECEVEFSAELTDAATEMMGSID